MRGRIESGQLVTLAPVDPAAVAVGDVVLVAWKGNYLLHLIKEIRADIPASAGQTVVDASGLLLLPGGVDTATSPILTPEGNLYFAAGGKSVVVPAGPAFRVAATNDLGDPSRTSPAAANGRLAPLVYQAAPGE